MGAEDSSRESQLCGASRRLTFPRQLGENQLTDLPREIGLLGSLEALAVSKRVDVVAHLTLAAVVQQCVDVRPH